MSTPFLTAAGGTAGAQGPQGAAGANGTPGAQGAQGAQGAAGSGAAGPWDWADPFYEVAGDQLSAVDPALWTDPSTIGGLTAATYTQPQSRIMRIDTSGAGDRAQGALIAVPAGDFVRCMRLGFQRNVLSTAASSVLVAGPVYVDGADVGNKSWCGPGVYWLGGDFSNQGYVFDNAAGANRWENYDPGTFGSVWGGKYIVECDCAIVRSGVFVSFYWGTVRGQLNKMKTWTMSAAAGYVGVRCQVLAGSPDRVDALIYAYRASLTEVP